MKVIKSLVVFGLILGMSGVTMASSPPWSTPYMYGHLSDWDASATPWAVSFGAWTDVSGTNPTWPAGTHPYGGAAEGSWGIFNLDQVLKGFTTGLNGIEAQSPNQSLWVTGQGGMQIVGMIYGTHDLEYIDSVGTRFTHATGLTVDVWMQPTGSALFGYDPTLGPGGRFGTDKYEGIGYNFDQSVNASAIHVLHMDSVNWFRGTAATGTSGQTSLDYAVNIIQGSDSSGTSDAYFTIDEAQSDPGWVAALKGGFFTSPMTGVKADFWMHTQLTPTGQNGWSFATGDPLRGTAPIPGAVVLGAIGLGVVASVRRLRRKAGAQQA